jgi:hypothetical protein
VHAHWVIFAWHRVPTHWSMGAGTGALVPVSLSDMLAQDSLLPEYVCMCIFRPGGLRPRKVPYWGTGRAKLRRSIYYEMLLAMRGLVLRDAKLRFPSECNFCTSDDRQPYLAYHRHERRIVSSLLPVSGRTRHSCQIAAAHQA